MLAAVSSCWRTSYLLVVPFPGVDLVGLSRPMHGTAMGRWSRGGALPAE